MTPQSTQKRHPKVPKMTPRVPKRYSKNNLYGWLGSWSDSHDYSNALKIHTVTPPQVQGAAPPTWGSAYLGCSVPCLGHCTPTWGPRFLFFLCECLRFLYCVVRARRGPWLHAANGLYGWLQALSAAVNVAMPGSLRKKRFLFVSLCIVRRGLWIHAANGLYSLSAAVNVAMRWSLRNCGLVGRARVAFRILFINSPNSACT